MGMSIAKRSVKPRKLLSRSLKLLLVYYVTAIFVTLIIGRFGLTQVNIAEILTFREIPEYTEFLLPLVFFPIVLIFLNYIAGNLLRNVYFIVALSVFLYVLGGILYGVNVHNDVILSLKGLFIGHGDLHRFGILMYFPVFGLGLILGQIMTLARDKKKKIMKRWLVVISLLSLFLVVTGISIWERWPPSLLFLLYGILYSFSLIYAHEKVASSNVINRLMIHMGTNALYYYSFHIVTIGLLITILNAATSDEFLIVLIVGLIFVCTELLTLLSKKISAVITSFLASNKGIRVFGH
jgi:hypothetical protein